MSTDSKYSSETLKNPLTDLEDDFVIQIVRLACASNDLVTNHEALSKFPSGENSYFFYNSISIVRETAKLALELSESDSLRFFSTETRNYFTKLSDALTPFDDGSLTKSVLKPIRDVNFHYKFPDVKTDTALVALTAQLKDAPKLAVAVDPDKDHLMTMRYTFADWFRNEYIDTHLDGEIAKTISEVCVVLVAFLDSLLADLMEKVSD